MEKQILNIDELYEYDDEQFLQKAYLLLLEREIDPQALVAYTNQLKKGKTKSFIINTLLNSQEFKSKGKDISNSNKLLKLSQLFHKHLLGKPIRDYGRPIRIMDNKLQKIVKVNESLIARLSPRSTQPAIHNYYNTNPIDTNIFNQQAELLTERILDLESENLELNKLLQNYLPTDQTTKESRGRICLNLTTTRRWRGRAVGIVRAERELAEFLLTTVPNVLFTIWIEEKKGFFHVPLSYAKEMLKDSWLDSSSKVLELKPDQFKKALELISEDTFISMGLDWDNNLTEEIYKLKNQAACTVVLACYDLIPILLPEHAVASDFKQVFQKHFVDMYYVADMIWADSQNSKKDLLNFWEKKAGLSLETAPNVKVITLGSNISIKNNSELNDNEHNQFRHIKSLGKFAMYVSTFESRKNHKLLVDIWREGYKEYGNRWPTLVIVGRHGWGVNDLVSQLPRMLTTRADKLIWLSDASDTLVSKLYDEADFTLFPSFYEGWGLGAAESLTKGKPCIVANNSSLEEATQKLMPSFHPLDFPNWKKQIELMAFDEQYMLDLKKIIIEKYISKTWLEFSKEFVDMISLKSVTNEILVKKSGVH